MAAKALGTLDVISKGRLILGVAAGWYAREFDAVGVPFKRRGRLFERNLDILTRLWTEDRVTLQVDEHNLREAVMRPRPVAAAASADPDRRLRRRRPQARGHERRRVAHRTSTRPRATGARGTRSSASPARPGAIRRRSAAPTSWRSTSARSREATEAPMRRWLETEWDVAAWSESTIEHAIRGSADECVDAAPRPRRLGRRPPRPHSLSLRARAGRADRPRHPRPA